MNVFEQFRKGWLRALKYTLNPLTRQLARVPFGSFAVVQHIGRQSGKRYEAPIIVSPLGSDFVIELTYGPNVDWRKNVLAGGGTLVWHGTSYAIDGIEPLGTETGQAAFPVPQRLILSLLGKTHFERMRVRH